MITARTSKPETNVWVYPYILHMHVVAIVSPVRLGFWALGRLSYLANMFTFLE